MCSVLVSQEVVDYLRQKRFPEHELPNIVTRCPTIFTQTVREIDANLGYLQRVFKLSGACVGEVCVCQPLFTDRCVWVCV